MERGLTCHDDHDESECNRLGGFFHESGKCSDQFNDRCPKCPPLVKKDLNEFSIFTSSSTNTAVLLGNNIVSGDVGGLASTYVKNIPYPFIGTFQYANTLATETALQLTKLYKETLKCECRHFLENCHNGCELEQGKHCKSKRTTDPLSLNGRVLVECEDNDLCYIIIYAHNGIVINPGTSFYTKDGKRANIFFVSGSWINITASLNVIGTYIAVNEINVVSSSLIKTKLYSLNGNITVNNSVVENYRLESCLPEKGRCMVRDRECKVSTEGDCERDGGRFHSEFRSCDRDDFGWAFWVMVFMFAVFVFILVYLIFCCKPNKNKYYNGVSVQ